jgi:hypothetical protein
MTSTKIPGALTEKITDPMSKSSIPTGEGKTDTEISVFSSDMEYIFIVYRFTI